MKVTLKKIAEKSNVSVPTVCRILKRKKSSYNKKELKVIKIANSLGYPYIEYYNQFKSIQKIAIILKLGTGEFYSSLLNGFIESSINTNYQFNIISIVKEKKPVQKVIEITNQYDGACIFLTEFKEKEYIKIKNNTLNKPIISIAPIPNPVFNTITFDSYRGGFLTAKFYFENGLNNVGLICGPNDNTEANNRKNGFIDFVNSNKSMNLNWIYDGDYSIESGHAAFNDLIENKIKKINLFSCNDAMAIGFIKEASEKKIKIPEEIKIIGYDNLPICVNMTPTLSSIKTNYKKLGKQVIFTFDYLTNKSLTESTLSLIPVELINRDSTKKL